MNYVEKTHTQKNLKQTGGVIVAQRLSKRWAVYLTYSKGIYTIA